MKKGFAIAFFVIAIIVCVSMMGKPWDLWDEIVDGSVTNSDDDKTLAEIEDKIYDIGGIDWVYVYSYSGELSVNVEARNYEPEKFCDFAESVRVEVLDILDDYIDTEEDLDSIYIGMSEDYSSGDNSYASLGWYTDNGKRGHFTYNDGDNSTVSFDNITIDELREEIADIDF